MRRALAVSTLVALALLVAAAGPAAGAPRPQRAGPEATVDFNGDGFADLAVGAPGEGIGKLQGAGALNVLFGSATGLQASGDVLFQGSQPAQGGPVAGTAETGDGFGAAVAKGLFNDDDFFDVAVGVPGEAVGSDTEAGAVNILYGSAVGLTAGPLIVQDNPEPLDSFGASLAAGDFNGDGFFDLVAGAPGEDLGGTVDAGAVIVLFGSPGGITTAGHQTLVQGSGISGSAEAGDAFGDALATGLLAGDDLADLVVGAPGEDVGAVTDAGAVNLLAGSASGLVNGSLKTQGNPESGDSFGASVTTGDFDQTAGDDVVVGAPAETVSGHPAAGAVSVFNGPPSGIGSERLLFQGTAGIPGSPEAGDAFGAVVAPTDADGIGQWDLAVGVPSETVGSDVQTGVVNLLAGSPTGPSGGSLVLQSNPEDFDSFGSAIAGGFFLHDFDDNGFFDLAVGAPLETVGTHQAAGALSVFYASGGGVLTPGPAFFQGSGGVGGTAESFDFFGAAME
jgi:FG-GAP repeat